MESSLLLGVVAIAAVVVAVLVFLRTGGGGRGDGALAELARLARSAENLAATQSELVGRLQQTQTGVNERLDALAKRLGDSLGEQTEKTGRSLNELNQRLAVIDRAQSNLKELSDQVVGLQDILSNKQARGAFGQTQMESLVRDALPPSAYKFQAKLSNGRVADCLLAMPNPPGPIVIDSKYPLERYQDYLAADDEAARTKAAKAFAADVLYHIKNIQERYIVPGETAESGLMFLPSEAVYAELHANFRGVIEESFRRRVWIVSPTTLWATLNTLRAVLKDARMREQAGVIQAEVANLLKDISRLDERVGKLQTHFELASEDIRLIRISTEKVAKRGERVEELELGEAQTASDLPPPEEG